MKQKKSYLDVFILLLLLCNNSNAYAKYEVIYQEGLDVANAINEKIQPTEIYEENLKNTNAIYLNTVAKGKVSFSENEKEILYSIAYQCPMLGGDAVWTARNLIELEEPQSNFNDENLCKEGQIYGKIAQTTPTVLIYPNPTNDVLSIFHSNTTTELNFQLFDMYGNLVHVRLLTSELQTIDVSLLSNGFYIAKINKGNETIVTSKIAIIHP
ncbi:MAG: Secretion system C-terminal sorting domain [Bacteroidota bacterium]|jgi:hypothetical protein